MAMQVSLSPVVSSSTPPEPIKRKQTTIVECFKKARAQAQAPLRDRPTADEVMRELSVLNLASGQS
jgi:hypothetical protein